MAISFEWWLSLSGEMKCFLLWCQSGLHRGEKGSFLAKADIHLHQGAWSALLVTSTLTSVPLHSSDSRQVCWDRTACTAHLSDVQRRQANSKLLKKSYLNRYGPETVVYWYGKASVDVVNFSVNSQGKEKFIYVTQFKHLSSLLWFYINECGEQ